MPDLVNRSKYSEVLTDYQDLDKVIPGIKHDVAICCIGTSLSKVSEVR